MPPAAAAPRPLGRVQFAAIGSGHANVFVEDGRWWFYCHFYDATDQGRSHLAIQPLQWDNEGWPVVKPANIDPP